MQNFHANLNSIFITLDNSYSMASIYKPNDAKIRRIQTSTHYTNNGNAYKMKPDSHGEYRVGANRNHFLCIQLHLLILVIISHFACISIGSLILNWC